MKKLALYLICFVCSFSSYGEVIEVDITGEVCSSPEIILGNPVMEAFVYTGIIVEGPTFPCIRPSWEYHVEGGQIINIIKPNGVIFHLNTPITSHFGKGHDVDQVTIQWLNDNSCNSVEFVGIAPGGLFCRQARDEKTLHVHSDFIPGPSLLSISSPEVISCGLNEFRLGIASGCNNYNNFVWRISGGPNVTTTGRTANLMVNNCPGNFEVSVTATGPCNSFTIEKAFTCTGPGTPEPVINMEDSYCCGEDILLNTAGTNGEDEYLIMICQTELPGGEDCINWRSTGWKEGEVGLNVDLLDIWNKNGTNSWKFWAGSYYRVSLVLRNECDDWEGVSHTFTVTPPDPYFEINDANGILVPDNTTVEKCVRNVTMNSSFASCGEEYLIMICQTNEPGGENCLNWRSTGWIEGEVSEISPIDLLSIWNKNGESSWLFWEGYSYRVSLVLRAECDSWEGYNQTFTVDGDCFTNGGGGEENSNGDAKDRNDETSQWSLDKEVQIYPTLINSSVDYLTVLIPEATLNTILLLYDVQGRVIQKNQIKEQSSEVSISALESGLYFAIVYENGKQIHQSKLIVTK